MKMNYRVLCITDRSDLPETELFIGLKKAGVDIEVICNPTGRHYDRLKNSDAPVIELILKSRLDLPGIRRLSDHLHKKHYDILYCFNNRAASNTLMASRGMHCKIITYRGVIGNISFLSPASWTTHLHPRVSRIVCVCEAVRKYILSRRLLWLKVPDERAVTIYKGHDLAWYQSPPADLLQFNIPRGAFVVGFSGRDRPRKGLHVLIDATRFLPPDAPIHFLLLGRLAGNQKISRRIKNSPFRRNFHLAGFRTDAPEVAAACDVFVQPSTKREGLAKTVIEAMAYGTPPIVSDVGGLPEMVVHNQSGIMVPHENPQILANAILELLKDPDKKKRLGGNAQERIRTRFNISDTVKKTKALFEDLAGES